MPKLAIVIPAYKPDFLSQALKSIAQQTCQDFTLYIGDDASPFDLIKIVEPFYEKINVVYKRFDENLGGDDLVGHWDRCVAMADQEEWLWLFSDDDVMSPNCVELFYACKKDNAEAKLFHINIHIIDEHGKVIHKCKPFGKHFKGSQIFSQKVKLRLTSTIVEYIFERNFFLMKGGFERFDLAWGSDDATWIKLANRDEIITIENALIYWRFSELNISSAVSDIKIVRRKINANVAYLIWIKKFFKENQIADDTTNIDKLKWILQTVKGSPFPFTDKIELNVEVCKAAKFDKLTYYWGAFYLGAGLVKSFLKNIK